MKYCVIMCGGIGSRFWPYSRQNFPKQFIDFFGTGRSLLQMSYDRILPLVPAENVLVVTNACYRDLVLEQLPDLKPEQVLCEPARRNTAPCIAWAAWHINALDPDAQMIVTPSDHLITRETVFQQCVSRGFDFIGERPALLTLGIKPTRPETGYGYIQVDPAPVDNDIYRVKTFTEKPDRHLAEVFLASGEFLWNSGIFMWRARTVIDAIRRWSPDLAHVFDSAKDVFGTEAETSWIKANFASCPSNSIDYAVMEKAENVHVERVDFGWNDLGTWSALYDQSPKNQQANVTQRCQVLAYDSTGNVFATNQHEKLIVIKGLHHFIVADTGDALLICPKSDEQSIKQMVDDVRIKTGDKYL